MRAVSHIHRKHVVVAPLNWGLGHATRCVPIITQLIAQDNHVTIASDGLALQWLRQRWPELPYMTLPSYSIRYRDRPMSINMLSALPTIQRAIKGEHGILREYTSQNNCDLVISDHRLGMHASEVHSIMIAHQLSIPHSNPLLRWTATQLQKSYIQKFDECWVPDDQSCSLSGDLSETDLSIPKKYIGPLSRFAQESTMSEGDNRRALIVLSGPEPARTKLERELVRMIGDLEGWTFDLVRGGRDLEVLTYPPNVNEVIDLADDAHLSRLYTQHDMVISRSGYSSLMDYHQMGKKALLVPTPGLPEQEYLAQRLVDHPDYRVITQDQLSSKNLLRGLTTLVGE